MYVFQGTNPTKMYYNAWDCLNKTENVVSPRGKKIKELRPTCFEFKNPYDRVTFVKGRRINPFFQLAESLWIVSGCSDVAWLEHFNSSIGQFSDNGKYFNAPYGERIRSWNKNDAHSIIINPKDQLYDAYLKLLADKDTRQAVVVIYNPMFDNATYTLVEKGRDLACNLVFTFKIRDNKLHMTVFNRSNDIHWGLFGANLCQFSTIQELMLSWLRNNPDDDSFSSLQLGTYTHVTDSLHMYIDDYGAKSISSVPPTQETFPQFESKNAPRMTLNFDQFTNFLGLFWRGINKCLMDDEFLLNTDYSLMFGNEDSYLTRCLKEGVIDSYWIFVIRAMLVYRLVKLGKLPEALQIMSELPACDWKVSLLHFLKKFIQKDLTETGDKTALNAYNSQYKILLSEFPQYADFLNEYLTIQENL